jgi:Chlorophyllase
VVCLLPGALLSLVCLAAAAQEPLLAPGPHPVGFRHAWAFDEGRVYRTAWDAGATYGAEKSARPLLVLEWYPASLGLDPAPMAHGEYLAIGSDDPRLAQLSAALSAFARDVLVQQVLGKPEAELDEPGREALARVLAAPTPCHRGAKPAAGPFPVVLYHSGAGSSFEDNAALCAYLASHGFVVLGGAFQEADGSSLAVDAGPGSVADLQFLARRAHGLPHADARRLALAGHSAGAQAALRAAAQPGCAADALVLLDTTQDYYGLALPLFESLVREVVEGRAHLTRPMLVAAGPEALFELMDSLSGAERAYLTVPGLGHDEYISQGLQRLARIEQGPRTAEEEAELARLAEVRGSYRILCETVRAFLEARLGRSEADFAARLARDAARPWTPAAPHLVAVPRGVDGPEPWDPAGDAPPSPRQFLRLFRAEGSAAACEVLRRFRAHEPRGPLYTSTMLAGSLLYGLAEAGRSAEATRYYATLKELEIPVLGLFEFLATISTMQGKPAQALHFLRFAHGLDPEHAGIAERLKELEGG